MLTISDLSVFYGNTLAVDSFDLEVKREFIVLFGPSGCGKTTILKAILGVSDPGMQTRGAVMLDGSPVIPGSGSIGAVFQGPVIPSWKTVADLCRMGKRMRVLPEKTQMSQIIDLLTRFRAPHIGDRYPYQLSGGEKQRAALAIALLNNPQALLLDEPTTFIDGFTRSIIWDFLEIDLRPLGMPTLIVSHDPTEALLLGDEILLLTKPGRVIERLCVPFPHPRDETLVRTEQFWELRQHLISRTT